MQMQTNLFRHINNTSFTIPPLENDMTEEQMTLADRVREILSDMEGPERGKQSRLAQIAQCERSAVNHWLSGQPTIAYSNAENIANYFGYRLKWVKDGVGPKRQTDKEENAPEEALFIIHINQKEMALVSAYRAASSMGKMLIEIACKGAPLEAKGI